MQPLWIAVIAGSLGFVGFNIYSLARGGAQLDPSVLTIDDGDREFDRQLLAPDAYAGDARPKPAPTQYTGCFDLIDRPVPCESETP